MKLKYKILALNAAALLIMLIILGPIIIQMSDNYNLSNILNYLQSQGDYSSIYIEQYVLNKAGNIFKVPNVMETDSSYLCSYLSKNINCRVQIYEGKTLLGDSEEILDNNIAIRPEVEATFKGNRAYFISRAKTRTLYFATPINIDGRYNYSLAFIYDLADADNMKRQNINLFIVTGLLAGSLSVFFSIFISGKITNPIKDLIEKAKLLSKGDLNQKVEVQSNDEVGELADNFNYMADSLRKMIHELKDEKDKQKNFFDNFTHEIRTPLTTILGYSELLWKTDDIDVKDKSLFHITSEGKRMLNMVESLLELSRLKRFDFQINKCDTNLKTLVEEVCDSIHYKLGRYNIDLNLKLENLSASVDPDLFKQVIINILDNSIKYSETSKIDIILEYSEAIKLTIKDYGVGIDPNTLENIFEPYYKGDKSRNSSIEGWGLGLSIVKEIIDKHGAAISVTSEKSKGTQVTITL